MVQAPDVEMGHSDIPQALVLLSEMNVSAQHVATLVDGMLERVRNGELTTDQGLSFLEVKYNMLLSYLINLTYVVLRKCSGEKIEDDPCIDRLVEIRTVLEKIRPIDHKLKYQIDKLVKTAVTGTGANDPTVFKANPENLIGKDDGTSDDDDEDKGGDEGKGKSERSGVYVPPKLAAVHYTGSETAQERNKRAQERAKKQLLSSAIMQDLRDEYLDVPAEVTQGGRAQRAAAAAGQAEREAYEEEYLTRLPAARADRHAARRRQTTTVGSLGDEVTDFGGGGGGVLPKKRKRPPKGGAKGKGKLKSHKRKRFH